MNQMFFDIDLFLERSGSSRCGVEDKRVQRIRQAIVRGVRGYAELAYKRKFPGLYGGIQIGWRQGKTLLCEPVDQIERFYSFFQDVYPAVVCGCSESLSFLRRSVSHNSRHSCEGRNPGKNGAVLFQIC